MSTSSTHTHSGSALNSQPDGADSEPARHHWQKAKQSLEQSLQTPPSELKTELTAAVRATVRLRDYAIERLRQEPPVEARPALRAIREQANVVLSLIAAVEYPASGLQRQQVEQALGLLQALESGGWLATG